MGVKTRKLGNVNNQIVQWQTVHTASTLNAVAGRGYFINTTSNICTVTLPTPAVGDIISFKDYARTWDTNKLIFASTKFDGGASETPEFTTQGQTVTLIYMDSTKGWSIINEDTSSDLAATFVTATGGTVTTSGDFKIHTFTGDSNFVVSAISSISANNEVSYLVAAGGGGGGGNDGGGGGAGGFRESKSGVDTYTQSPIAGATDITVSTSTYPITVGGGGALGPPGSPGAAGSNSVFSTITSAGGGGGASEDGSRNGGNGGSGGGGGAGGGTPGPGGSGNTPPVSPAQGTPGGTGAVGPTPASQRNGGAGGGATAAGQVGQANSRGGTGGAGATSSINGTPTGRAGGGGGGGRQGGGPASNGGGAGSDTNTQSTAGTANTGGGGGGSGEGATSNTGGKGIVIIRYKFQ